MPDTKILLQEIVAYAKRNEIIRILTLEGSRANSNIQQDVLQDYDISFFAERKHIANLVQDLAWTECFGKCLMIQTPEDMELFPPDLPEGWISYLMIFASGVRVDLSFIPLEDKELYFGNEKLIKVLLDKDNCLDKDLQPSESQFFIQTLNQRRFNDCANEFYWLFHCTIKGILRKEVLYVNTHLEMMRESLLIMLAWQIGMMKIDCKQEYYEFNFSLGKHFKFLPDYLDSKKRIKLYKTYRLGDIKKAKKALKHMESLFLQAAFFVARKANISTIQLKTYNKNVHYYSDILKKLHKKY